MTKSYIDSHAHLTSDAVYSGIDALLERAKNADIDAIINICTDLTTLERGLELSKRYDFVYNTASTTPHDVEKEGDFFFPYVEKAAKNGDLVAIGETGLDYYYSHSPKDLQLDFLRRYLILSLECNLPVVIHCREAFEDLFSTLDSEYKVNGKHKVGVLHCFTGNEKEAEGVIDRGWYLSLSGIVTFKKSELLRRVAKLVPIDQLLIETDTPYLAPQSKRGSVNEPSYITETCRLIAEVKGISEFEVATITAKNAKCLFNLTINERAK